MKNEQFPAEVLAQHIAVLGKTGSGKTYAAKGAIVEPLLAAGRRVGIVDPTGAWWGLRSSSDGKGAGFPILVLGGDHGDLPLPPLGGAAVARLLVEQGVNLVADTSQLTVGERTRWFIDFAGTVHRLNKVPLHLVLDEAHNFAPQGKVLDPDAGKMLHATNRLAAEGRSRGIRLAMITQRPQKLHKDTLTSADTLIAMRVLAPHDRAAIEDWIKGCGDIAQGKEVLNLLASLQRGEGWVWYPEGSFLHRMKFPRIRTFDSSATPTGDAITAPKAAAQIDLTEIKAALADAVKDAEANDPKLLRQRIAQLEKELAAKKPAAKGDDQVVTALRRELDAVTRSRDTTQLVLNGWHDRARKIAKTLLESVGDVALGTRQPEKLAAAVVRHEVRHEAAVRLAAPAPRPAPAQASEGVSGPQQRILDGLAWLAAFGVEQPTRECLGARVGVVSSSGSFRNNLGALRTSGLIDYPGAGTVGLTDVGREKANPPEGTPTLQDLHDAWLSLVTNPQAAILREVIGACPGALSRAALGIRIGVIDSSGSFRNNLGRLRTLGAIDYPTQGEVRAADILFPKGFA